MHRTHTIKISYKVNSSEKLKFNKCVYLKGLGKISNGVEDYNDFEKSFDDLEIQYPKHVEKSNYVKDLNIIYNYDCDNTLVIDDMVVNST